MLAKPSTLPNSVDSRLGALADQELSDWLIAEHPQLYGAPPPAGAELAQEPRADATVAQESAPRNDLWRMLAVVGLLLAVGAAYVFGLAMRARMRADIPPLVSLVTPSHVAATKKLLSRHDNLGPAAAAKLERAQALVAAKEVRTSTRAIAARPLPNIQPAPRRVQVPLLAAKTHAATKPRFREQVSELHAPALLSSGALSDAPAASSGSDTDATDAAESGSLGRQVPHGPVWSENGPGVVVPGGIVLGGGRFPGGGGMPGGCPRH